MTKPHSRPRLWISRALTAAAVAALATASGCASGAASSPSFEELRDSLPRFEGAYVVEGDLLIRSERALRDYYEATYALGDDEEGEGLSSTEQGLSINQFDGRDDIYNSGTQLNLTYCVSTAFHSISATKHGEIVSALATAASRWEAIVHANFTYVSAQDGSCTNTNTNVWFNVRPSGQNDGWSFAFFPHEARAHRELVVGNLSGGADLMTHELGHILGFRHEHGRSEFPGAGCAEGGLRPITGYDSGSVMHYPSWATCGGTSSTYAISRRDRIGAQDVFAPPTHTCGILAQETCAARGATCSVAFNTSGGRHDLCRWGAASSQASCNATRGGIWTPAGSGFAVSWPTAVPPGAAGACISQTGNFSCSAADQDLCLRHDASCERAFDVNGHRHDLCRWHTNASQASCSSTAGIWTTASSGFAQGWPTAVPAGAAGACITQVNNLK